MFLLIALCHVIYIIDKRLEVDSNLNDIPNIGAVTWMVLSKKKGIRAAQRRAVKKIIGKVEDELRKDVDASESELRRKKKDMLAGTDREILEETSYDRMEEEIDDANGYVLAIDRSLSKLYPVYQIYRQETWETWILTLTNLCLLDKISHNHTCNICK